MNNQDCFWCNENKVCPPHPLTEIHINNLSTRIGWLEIFKDRVDKEIPDINLNIDNLKKEIIELRKEIEKLKMPKAPFANPIYKFIQCLETGGIAQVEIHEAKEEKEKPKFKVGQIWKRRDGKLTTIVNTSHSTFWPILDSHNNYHALDGCYDSSKYKYPEDLMELVIAFSCYDNAAKEEKPKFKVGQWWETRNGNHRFKITIVDEELDWPIQSSNFSEDFYTNNIFKWDLYGNLEMKEDDLDLVKLIEDVE